MTCILGLEDKSGVWLASDSYLGDETSQYPLDRPKWFHKGALTFAYSGDVRAAQLVEFGVTFRPQRKTEDSLGYLVTVVATGIRAALQEVTNPRAEFLIVCRRRLYRMAEDFSLLRCSAGMAAIGIGAPFALGALAGTLSNGVTHPPEKALSLALTHASRFSQFVQGPFHIQKFPTQD